MKTVQITAEMRGWLSLKEIQELPPLRQKMLLNGIAARIGLIAMVGEQEAEQLWQERVRLVRSQVAKEDLGNLAGKIAVVRLRAPEDFDPYIWIVHGQRFRFVGQLTAPEEVWGMCLLEEPRDDTVYVSIAINPSWEEGTACGWMPGRDVKRYGAKPRS
jgi:hypothetical protein